MISSNLAKQIILAASKTGADFVEIFVEKTTSKSISCENTAVETAGKNVAYGVGLRLLQGTNSSYGYTNDLSKESLLKLAEDLSKAFNGEQIISDVTFKTKKLKNLCPVTKPLGDTTDEEIISLLKKVGNTIHNEDKRIVRSIVSFGHTHKDIELYNSNGLHFIDHKDRGRMGILAVAMGEGVIETSFEGPGGSVGFEYFEQLDVEALAKDVVRVSIQNLTAKECPSGKMPVVMGNGFGGVLFHESCGHPLEASAVSKGLSSFAGKLGQKIASDVVSAYDDGTIQNGWGTNNVDDEGNPTQCTCLIKNGVLTNYLVDELNGRRMGAKANGASRRQSYKYEPTSRMSNTYIANGTSTPEEIIASTKLGLYAAKMGGGSVNPATGEFNFSVSEGYIIRDGKICEPVRGATLIGKGSEVLMNIDMVGNDLLRAQGMCGASSGSIPTDVGQPTLRIKEITVGGRGGELK